MPQNYLSVGTRDVFGGVNGWGVSKRKMVTHVVGSDTYN